MKILVTGGAGFIGSHVADALSDAKHQVTIFDTQKSAFLRPDQNMVVGNILDQQCLTTLAREHEVVYHFAGIADIDECAERPVDTAEINIVGTVRLLEAARCGNIKRFIFASSAYVNGNSGYFYRSSKQACESFIENYRELYGLEYTCLRYGSLYGGRADEKNSIYNLLRQALENNSIVYHGTGEEQREYIHVKDAAESSVKILAPEYANSYITLTGNEKIRYLDLLEMINEILENTLTITIKPSDRKAHYKITPYSFSPKLGLKLVNNPHIDLGQGLIDCMGEIHAQVAKVAQGKNR